MTNVHSLATQIDAALGAPGQLPIFIGAPYLPLLQQWPQDRPAIVIEPDRAIAAQYRQYTRPPLYFCAGHQLLPRGAANERFVNLALRTALTDTVAQIAHLACDHAAHVTIDANTTIYVDSTQDWHKEIAHRLPPYLQLLQRIGKWQRQQRPLWQHAHARDRTNTCILSERAGDHTARTALFGHIDAQLHAIPLTVASTAHPHPATIDDCFDAARTSAEALFQAIAAERATWVSCRNLSIFPTLEHMLCIMPMLHTTGTPLLCAMTDWFHFIMPGMLGGIQWFPSLRRCTSAQLALHSMYPADSALHHPPAHSPHLLPYAYLATSEAITAPVRAPLPQRGDSATDVLIAHTARNHITLDVMSPPEQAWIHGVWTLQSQMPHLPVDAVAHRLLTWLHRTIADPAHPLHADAVRLRLNELDFCYYVITRRQQLITVVPQLSQQYRVQIIGSGWERWLPAALVAPTTDRAALNEHYQQAGVTLICNSMYERGVPQPEALMCLAAGGLPLIAAPTLFPDSPSIWPGPVAEHLPTFNSLAAIPGQIDALLADWPARQQLITQLQTAWQPTLAQTHQHSIADLQRRPLPAPPTPELHITGNAETDTALRQASLAYLAMIVGQPDLASTYWRTALDTAPLPLSTWTAQALQSCSSCK